MSVRLGETHFSQPKVMQGITPMAVASRESAEPMLRMKEVDKEKRLLGTHMLSVRDDHELSIPDKP